MINKYKNTVYGSVRQFIQKNIRFFRGMVFVVTGLIIVLFYPNEASFKFDYRKNKPWMYEDLIAPFDFSINKTDADFKQEKERVKQTVVPYFNYDSVVTQKKRDEFVIALNDCRTTGMPIKFTDGEAKKLLPILDSVYAKGIIQSQRSDNGAQQTQTVQLVKSNSVETRSRSDFFTIVSADKYIQSKLVSMGFSDVSSVKSFVESFLTHNVIYDGITTQKELNMAFDNISPSYGLVQKGERIISKGELITTEKYQILSSLEMQYQGGDYKAVGGFGFVIGKSLLIFLVLFILYFYVYLFDKKVFYRLKRIALLSTVFLSMVVPAFVLYSYAPEYLLAFPFCIFAIANKVFFSSRVSILSYVMAVLLVGSFVVGGFEFALIQILVGLSAILSLKSLYRRAQFVTTALLVFGVYLLLFTIKSLMFDNGLDSINTQQLWLYVISAALTLMTYPFLYILERIFRLVTDFTLLELSNTNLPLLRELATKAPGTFLHSVLVSNIAEEVTHKINGNMLLVRTGALYHDIGKLSNPSFFIENQHGVNPHDELPANESAAIIINHVAEGIAIARKYKLPDEIMGFIRTHHGTRKTAYFYNKYMLNNMAKAVDDSLFTYPGPTPRTKEEAVLMLADILEAATRSMKEHTKENISTFVEDMVDKLIENHQFDQANITFKDLLVIKETFKSQLINIYHKRIEYPKI